LGWIRADLLSILKREAKEKSKQKLRELEYYLRRKIPITIADNYVNLRRRGLKH